MLLKGVLWDFLGKGLNQVVSLIISVILARVLEPEQFGLLGMALVIINIAQMFGDIGFSAGVVQAKSVGYIQKNTIFWLNVLVGGLLTSITYFSSSLIVSYYRVPEVGSVFVALSPMFFLGSFSVLPLALLKREVDFKSIAFVNFVAIVLSGLTGVIMAINDFGVYALVAQSLVHYVTLSATVWFFIQWRPSVIFSKFFRISSIKEIWKFSSNLFYAEVFNTIFNRLDVIIIGKLFSTSVLGFYTRAISLYNLIIKYSSGSISQVFFPVISKMQDDIAGVKALILKSCHAISFVVFFLIGFFYLNSDEFIIILLSEKWIQSSEYLRIILLSSFAYPLSVTMMNVLSGLGNSKLYFRIEVVKKVLLSVTYIVGFQYGIIGFLYGLIFNRSIATLINIYFGGKEINLKVTEVMRIVSIYVLLSFIAYLVSFGLSSYLFIQENVYISFMTKAVIFTFLYFCLNFVFKRRGLFLLIEITQGLRSNL